MGIQSARKKLTSRLAETGTLALYRLFGRIPASVDEARGLRILVYHGVVPQNPFRFNSRFISSALFERHLRLFRGHFNVLSSAEA